LDGLCGLADIVLVCLQPDVGWLGGKVRQGVDALVEVKKLVRLGRAVHLVELDRHLNPNGQIVAGFFDELGEGAGLAHVELFDAARVVDIDCLVPGLELF